MRYRFIAQVAVCALTLCAVAPTVASAITANIHIHGTSGQGVYLRPTPDTSQPGLRLIPEGASPDYNCTART